MEEIAMPDLQIGDIIRMPHEPVDWQVHIPPSAARGASEGNLRFWYRVLFASSAEVAEVHEAPADTQFPIVYRPRMYDVPEPPPLSQPELDILALAAEQLASHADHGGDGAWEPCDLMRGSSGQEYVLGPDVTGWYALIEGRVIEVSIRYASPERTHDVCMELDERYALAQADEDEDEDPGCDISGE